VLRQYQSISQNYNVLSTSSLLENITVIELAA